MHKETTQFLKVTTKTESTNPTSVKVWGKGHKGGKQQPQLNVSKQPTQFPYIKEYLLAQKRVAS